MSKYIDADKAIKDYARYGIKHFYDATDLEAMLNECPAADVQEVRHGRWLHLHLDPDDITGHTKGECSICGKLRIVDNYCPNCGSRMDLDGDTE